MKLETTISPRKDGVVNVEFGKVKYVFAADEEGRLVADVDEESIIANLLNSGNFIPADDADFEVAALIAAPAEESDEDDDEDSDEEELNGLPVEEQTPPSGRKPRKAK
jgi:hypothetical protein